MLSANLRHTGRRCILRRGLATTTSRRAGVSSSTTLASAQAGYVLLTAAVGAAAVTAAVAFPQRTALDPDVELLQPAQPTTETATGIIFPPSCNGYTLVGCGVRVKYGFIKVYAVGTYIDPKELALLKNPSRNDIAAALLDPKYSRTIRIVMNRGLSIDKYTSAIVEALEPRMKGQDLQALEEFKKLNPPVDLQEGDVMEMTVRGDVLEYRNASGGVGQIQSAVFTRALCDVYYGDDPVSPTHKEQVLDGIAKVEWDVGFLQVE